MRREPRARRDQKCVHCGKPKKQSRAAVGKTRNRLPVGAKPTRMGKDLWLDELAKDPFCSRPCCEAFLGVPQRQSRAYS